jgi:DNA-binding transcriptional LysR family regulator
MKWDDRIGRRLRLKDLHTLQTVAELGSMAKASGRLALSQPAISKAVSDMEHALGASLLERSSRGVELTESGRLLVERARVIFDEVRQGISDIENLSDPAQGTIRIGTTEPVTGIVSEIISHLASKYPRLSYDVIVTDLDTLMSELRERKHDVLVSRWDTLRVADDLKAQLLFKSPLAVMASRGHPLLLRKKLDLGDLMQEQWTLSPVDSFLGRTVVDLFRRRKLPLPTAIVTTISIHMRLDLLASGRFLTVLPAQILQHPSNKAWLRALDVDLSDSSQPVALVTLKRRRSGGAIRFFEEASLDATTMMAREARPKAQRRST